MCAPLSMKVSAVSHWVAAAAMDDTTTQRGWSERHADSLLVVLAPYVLVGIPLNLYLYHDVIDKRWRPIRQILKFCAIYGALSGLSLALLVWYATVQFFAEDFKEFGAAVLSCILAVYGLYLFSRQMFILRFYRTCLKSRVDTIRSEYVLPDGETTLKSKRFFPRWPQDDKGPSYGRLSAVFLDDNYPGEGPRVTWLQWASEVRDWPEMMVRAGLWIRLGVIPSHLSFYAGLRPPPDPGSIGATSESIGLWTASSLKLAFLHPQDQSSNRTDTESLKTFEECVKGAKGTLVQWQQALSLAPASEWSQALSELPSGWIEGLDTPDVGWEVFLALALHSDGPERTPRQTTTHADTFKKDVENCVRATLVGHNGYVTAELLMGGFPDDDPEALSWMRDVLTLSDESFRLATLMRRENSLAGRPLCVGVDLLVALALLLGAKTQSLKFLPTREWGGLQDVLTSRRHHDLLQLEGMAEILLRSSLAHWESRRKNDSSADAAHAKYSLGMFLVDKVREFTVPWV